MFGVFDITAANNQLLTLFEASNNFCAISKQHCTTENGKKNWADLILICISFEREIESERGKEISGVYGSIKCKSNKQAIEKRAQNFVSPKNFYSMNKLNYMIAFQDGIEKVWMAQLLRNRKEIGKMGVERGRVKNHELFVVKMYIDTIW